MKQLVKHSQFISIDATNLFHCANLFEAERLDNRANGVSLMCTVRRSMRERCCSTKPRLYELLQIVGYVCSEIKAASAQFTRA